MPPPNCHISDHWQTMAFWPPCQFAVLLTTGSNWPSYGILNSPSKLPYLLAYNGQSNWPLSICQMSALTDWLFYGILNPHSSCHTPDHQLPYYQVLTSNRQSEQWHFSKPLQIAIPFFFLLSIPRFAPLAVWHFNPPPICHTLFLSSPVLPPGCMAFQTLSPICCAFFCPDPDLISVPDLIFCYGISDPPSNLPYSGPSLIPLVMALQQFKAQQVQFSF